MNNFFGTKLNTAFLLVLIILMVVALKVMFYNKSTYLPFLTDKKTEEVMDKSKILGNRDDLVSFSIWPGTKVHGVMSYRGVVQNNYFFEANIRINVLDANKKILLQSNAHSTTDWMTAGPVSFEGSLDFSKLPKGPAYIEIHNDNPSDLPQNDKSILIPIVIE